MADISDELLMRLADGELDTPTARRIETEAAADPRLGERLALFRQTRALAAEAMAPLAGTPLPPALYDRVAAMVAAQREAWTERAPAETRTEAGTRAMPPPRAGAEGPAREARGAGAPASPGGQAAATGDTGTGVREAPDEAAVVALAARRRERTAAAHRRWPAALAASLLLAAATGLGGFWLGHRDHAVELALAPGPINDEALAAALSSLPGGAMQPVRGGNLHLTATYRDGGDALCREAELKASAPGHSIRFIACHEAQGWMTQIAVAAGPDEGYAPASGETPLDLWLELSAASPPLDAAAERAALAALAPAAEGGDR